MADAEELIRQPHGKEQQIKMEIVSMIHGGESPYDVIYHVAQWLEKASGEPGYAQYVLDAMRTVYGCALQHVRPMEDELRDVEARLVRIRAAYEDPVFTEEEKKRIRFAIDLHVKNIARLKECIARAKANGEPAEIVKN
ncbi:hypothetical protein [Selenomonas sp. oral taxon 136]|uniref:hypothetical protein n=1 Tax=Selenomonas sp. oral taxon 136 TaxID=713030 RepID=UPI0007680268|nr:hypothetical protein [Selenomonas sp. oral taxon 136]AME03373.1 hypothetical protein AXE86_04345 [Selenomonas sp. oral taxon 136]